MHKSRILISILAIFFAGKVFSQTTIVEDVIGISETQNVETGYNPYLNPGVGVCRDGTDSCYVQGGGEALPGGPNRNQPKGGDLNNCENPANKTKCDAYNACKSAYNRASVTCTSQQNVGTAQQLVGSFQQYQSAGNIKEACESAKQLAGISMAANVAFSYACKNATTNCITKCSNLSNSEYMMPQGSERPYELKNVCEGYKATYVDAAVQQGVASALSYAGSQACIDASSGKCIGDNAYNDEECQQFCVKPGRQDHPKCRIAMNNCNDSQYASQNAQYCNCIRNPFSPQCGTNLGGLPTSALNGAPPLQDLEIPPGAYDYEGNNIQGSRSDFGGANGGGSGFNGAGGGSSALGGNETQGNGDDPIDKNILSGASGGGGMVGGFGGGGYNEGGGGGGNKAGGSKDPDGIDLKAFLPGGKKDPKRSPASAYGDASITPANGLTNFQKVTKKFLEKIQNGELRP